MASISDAIFWAPKSRVFKVSKDFLIRPCRWWQESVRWKCFCSLSWSETCGIFKGATTPKLRANRRLPKKVCGLAGPIVVPMVGHSSKDVILDQWASSVRTTRFRLQPLDDAAVGISRPVSARSVAEVAVKHGGAVSETWSVRWKRNPPPPSASLGAFVVISSCVVPVFFGLPSGVASTSVQRHQTRSTDGNFFSTVPVSFQGHSGDVISSECGKTQSLKKKPVESVFFGCENTFPSVHVSFWFRIWLMFFILTSRPHVFRTSHQVCGGGRWYCG